MSARGLWLRTLVLLAALVLTVSFTALCGYVTGLREAPAWWQFTGMALPASVGFILAASGVLAGTVRRVSDHDAGLARTLPFFTSAAAMVMVLGVVSLVTNATQAGALRAVSQTWETKAQLERFASAFERVEASARAHALVGDDATLARYRSDRADLLAQFEALRPLLVEPAQARRLRDVQPLVLGRFGRHDAMIADRSVGPAALARLLEPPAADDVWARLVELQAEESRRLADNEAVTARRLEAMRASLFAGALLTLALGATAFQMLRRAQAALRAANDTLERRVAERTRELEESARIVAGNERNLRFLADTMPQLVWTTSRDGRVVSLNRGWCVFLGVDEAGALAALPDVVHPDDRAATRAEWAAMLREERIGIGELRLRRGDGEYRWHLWRAHPQRDDDGRVVRWVGTSTDVHDQKLLAAELERRVSARTAEVAESEERFRNAFEFAGIGMAIVGLDGRWLRVNRAMCDIVGYTETELLQKTFQDLTHPDDLDADLAHVQELLDGRRRFYQMEKRYFHRAGHVVWIRLTASLVRTPDGAPLHFVSQVEDVTARKELEASLAEARDAALAASRLKSEFLANMSHEIRTPMNGIIGMSGLLLDSPLGDEQREMTRIIQGSAEGLLTIINDILDFSKIEAGKLRIDPEEFDLRELVEETLAALAPRAHEKGLELLGDSESSCATMLVGDAGRIRQVLTNLVGNAIKFTSRGEVVVRVKERRSPTGRVGFRVAVSDTGIGIATAAQPHIFEPFTQADGTATRRYGGTGLGLAISRQLVDLMGGELNFESDVERGSTFWFDLDLPRGEPPPPGDPVRLPADLSILVVDDNATSRAILLTQLANAGVKGDAAEGGTQAMAELRARAAAGRPYQVALLDWQMPGQSGLELAAAIRADPTLAGTRLMLLSAAGPLPDLVAAAAVGFAAFLNKPVREAQLHRALARSLADASRNAPPPSPAHRAAAHAVPVSATGLHVLLVEDNPANQVVSLMMLRKMGHVVDLVSNGEQALVRLRERTYDAIVMDCQMPVLDGYETTRRIRAGAVPGLDPRVPIVALTAYAMPSDRLKCVEAGMDDYVAKPVHGDELRAALDRCSAGRKPLRENTATAVAASHPVVDEQRLAELQRLPGQHGPSLLPELITLFLQKEPARYTRLLRVADARDADELARVAQALATACANLGAEEAHVAAQALEELARKPDWSQLTLRLADLSAAWQRLTTELQRRAAGGA
jgi:PAS domain S-box-containing protein